MVQVTDESAHQWVVKCEEKGCDRKIGVPKRIKQNGKTTLVEKPTARWCIDHPPHQ